jgi:hypothetical protein
MLLKLIHVFNVMMDLLLLMELAFSRLLYLIVPLCKMGNVPIATPAIMLKVETAQKYQFYAQAILWQLEHALVALAVIL